jgi:hypothetical protein
MPWEQRGGKRYYYRTERRAGRAARRYVGSGDVAELAAAADELRRLQRAAAKRRCQEQRQRLLEAEAPLLELCFLADGLARAALLAAGYHQHDRGAWRRRHEHRDEA